MTETKYPTQDDGLKKLAGSRMRSLDVFNLVGGLFLVILGILLKSAVWLVGVAILGGVGWRRYRAGRQQ